MKSCVLLICCVALLGSIAAEGSGNSFEESEDSFEEFKTWVMGKLEALQKDITASSSTSLSSVRIAHRFNLEMVEQMKELSNKIEDVSRRVKPPSPRRCGFTADYLNEEMQKADNISVKVVIMLQFIEREIECGRYALPRIHEMARMIYASHITKEQAVEQGDKLKKEGKWFQAFIFYYSSSKMGPLDGEDAVKFITDRIRMIVDAAWVSNKTEWKTHVTSHVIPILEELLSDYHKLTKGDAAYYNRLLTYNYYNLGVLFQQIEDHPSFAQVMEFAMNTMDDYFGKDASKYRIYAMTLNRLCEAYVMTLRYQEAKQKCIAARKAINRVTNWTTSEEKKKTMDKYKANMNWVNLRIKFSVKPKQN